MTSYSSIEREFSTFDTTPCDEPCAQVGKDGYYEIARLEARTLVDQLRRTFGNEPEGVRVRIRTKNHDYGEYVDVAIDVDISRPEAIDWAFAVENDFPQKWDDEARAALRRGDT